MKFKQSRERKKLIVETYNKGRYTPKELAAKFKLTKEYIYMIIKTHA